MDSAKSQPFKQDKGIDPLRMHFVDKLFVTLAHAFTIIKCVFLMWLKLEFAATEFCFMQSTSL